MKGSPSIASWQEIHNEKVKNNPKYVTSMSPDRGPNMAVVMLDSVISRVSEIFEFGVGPGANAIFLAEKWHSLQVLDVSDEMMKEFQKNVSEKWLNIPFEICPAQDYTPSKNYDAFISTYVLHFMPIDDAQEVINCMQSYTNPGGYNVLGMFMSESSWSRPDRFYPTIQTIYDLYDWWTIVKETVFSQSNIDGNKSQHMNIMLQKPM